MNPVENQLHELNKKLLVILSIQSGVIGMEALSYLTGWSPSTIHKKTSKGELPNSKPFGKTLFFDVDKIRTVLLSNPSKTVEEITQEAIEYVHLSSKSK